MGAAMPAGEPLFACAVCRGQGQLMLRQQANGRWCAVCSRHPACQRTEWLPTCIATAVVDGQCSTCSNAFGMEVHTMRLQLRSQPGGGADETTLHGVCAAGCSNTLARL